MATTTKDVEPLGLPGFAADYAGTSFLIPGSPYPSTYVIRYDSNVTWYEVTYLISKHDEDEQRASFETIEEVATFLKEAEEG